MKAEILACVHCSRVKRHGAWVVLTALEVLRLKGRKEEWEVKVSVCPDCAKQMGLPANGGEKSG